MAKIRQVLKFVALMPCLFVTGCSDDDAAKEPTNLNAAFSEAKAAFYSVDPENNRVGNFIVQAEEGDLQLVVTLYNALNDTDNIPQPADGTYVVGGDYSKTLCVKTDNGATYWTKGSQTYRAKTGTVAVVSDGASDRVIGELISEDGSLISFKVEGVVFEPEASEFIQLATLDNYAYQAAYSRGIYTLAFSNEAGDAVNVVLYNQVASTATKRAIPDGVYLGANSGLMHALLLQTSSWTRNGVTYVPQRAICSVVSDVENVTISGQMFDKTNHSVRFSFTQSLESLNAESEYLYRTLAGKWDMQTDKWFVYNATTKVWEIATSGAEYSFSMIGDPTNKKMLASGLFDETFGGIIDKDDEGYYISCNPLYNPVAQVYTLSSTYYLYMTLIDPSLMKVLSYTKNIRLTLSEDHKTFQVQGQTGTVTDSAGASVTAKYDYFGLVGMNQSTGGLTYFSNWQYLNLPKFIHQTATPTPDAKNRAARCAAIESVCLPAQITDEISVISASEIIGIKVF